MNRTLITGLALLAAAACTTGTIDAPDPSDDSSLRTTVDVSARLEQLPQVVIDYDRDLLDERETRVLQKLIEASKLIDEIFLIQVSDENLELRSELYEKAKTSAKWRDVYDYFRIMYGPWDRLAGGEPFIAGVGPKPDGAGFYPPDITTEELEEWVRNVPANQANVQGLFTMIERRDGRLVAVPYSQKFANYLVPAAEKMREAAAITANASLREYLERRADALLTDDYYESDLAWMDLDSALEVVIGPYEVYEDNLNNYKAAFETFITVVDREESERLRRYVSHLPRMEANLPIPAEHRNPNRGAESPIKVVQEAFTAGDTRAGVQTAAFNLPNDERVREAKGSKKVLLKNVMEAKYAQAGFPIAERILDQEQVRLVGFDAFFNHVLFHELSHGLGPGIIDGPDGRVEARLLLKDAYSPIEECKADVLGVWNLMYAMDNDLQNDFGREELFATYAGMMFRSMRFGLDSAHGRGNAIQWNWLREKGAILESRGRFRVVNEVMESAIRSLANELLMIEATGDYDRAQRLLGRYGVTTSEIESVIARLADLPVDIAPVYVAAGEQKTR
ncbi:MAG: peptidase [Acidobacteria bacterium]|nr:peptidase [Acidobacteriota bacterium]